jgi:hypothetical protein
VNLAEGITIVPILHGRASFAAHIRALCGSEGFDCIAVDLPPAFEEELSAGIDNLPTLSAVIARTVDGPAYYIPTDPCDAAIEGVRQARQTRVPHPFVGLPVIHTPEPLPPLPDEYAITRIGFEAYGALCLQALGNPAQGSEDDIAGQYIAWRLHQLRSRHIRILAIVHLRRFARVVYHFAQEKSHNLSFPSRPSYNPITCVINPDHLYFALGELPYVTGKFEKERFDPLAQSVDIVETVKDLFRETRDQYCSKDDIIDMPPARIQSALTFLRNLTVMEGRFIPSLLDIVTAAKGVGGNNFAVRILKNAKYYPYLPFESPEPMVSVGINHIMFPHAEEPIDAVNLLRDTRLFWRRIPIKPDPSELRKKHYRFIWNPLGMCSHMPEDRRIENFNTHLRTKALRVLSEDCIKSEPFSASIKDGIDIRETVRNWFTNKIYVREIPPTRGNVDTVIIIFDEDHDERYPQCATWYAEHKEESTLTFYATDPFEEMIGPGIARSRYGGLSLLFPPRPVPNAFEITEHMPLKKLSHRLCYGALLFSRERIVAYAAAKKPGIVVTQIARKLKKHIIWIPLVNFSSETLRRLRLFHVLNGKTVRSWASRYIGD